MSFPWLVQETGECKDFALEALPAPCHKPMSGFSMDYDLYLIHLLFFSLPSTMLGALNV